jgi:hypothetical protein
MAQDIIRSNSVLYFFSGLIQSNSYIVMEKLKRSGAEPSNEKHINSHYGNGNDQHNVH